MAGMIEPYHRTADEPNKTSTVLLVAGVSTFFADANLTERIGQAGAPS
jgi:hypothetical protein